MNKKSVTKHSGKIVDIFWNGFIDEEHFSLFKENLSEVLSIACEIRIWVTSSGGDLNVGILVYDYLTNLKKILPGIKISTIASSEVGSAAVLVYLVGEHRFITSNTYIFLHEVAFAFGETPYRINTIELLTMGLRFGSARYETIISENSGGLLTPKKIRNMMKRETLLNPEQAVKVGIAHKILS